MRRYVLLGVLTLAQVVTTNCGAARLTGQESAGNTRLSSAPVDGRYGTTSNVDAAMEAARMARIAVKDRQKRIAGDSAKIVKLSTEVRGEVASGMAKETPIDAIRKVEEIEKLAHDLKHRMSGNV